MKCPNCEYEHSWVTEGNEGEFWELPIRLERREERDYYGFIECESGIYGCPKCKFVFHNN